MITTAQPTAPINECAQQMGTRGPLAKAKTVDQPVAPPPAAVYREAAYDDLGPDAIDAIREARPLQSELS